VRGCGTGAPPKIHDETEAEGRAMPHAYSLQDRRILIVGAAGGIGSETARVCATLGAELLLTDQAEPAALAGELRAAGSRAGSAACDITDRAAVESLAAAAGALDGLILLAGYCPWDDWAEDGWDAVFARVIDVNLLGVIHVARACLPRMAARRSGRIVLVGSVAGRMGGVKASPHYVAAKGGVAALVKWLARKAAPDGVLVNGIAPGVTDTPMTAGHGLSVEAVPLKRMAAPAEIAWPIAFLCSDAASYVCGTMLDVNGGLFMN